MTENNRVSAKSAAISFTSSAVKKAEKADKQDSLTQDGERADYYTEEEQDSVRSGEKLDETYDESPPYSAPAGPTESLAGASSDNRINNVDKSIAEKIVKVSTTGTKVQDIDKGRKDEPGFVKAPLEIKIAQETGGQKQGNTPETPMGSPPPKAGKAREEIGDREGTDRQIKIEAAINGVVKECKAVLGEIIRQSSGKGKVISGKDVVVTDMAEIRGHLLKKGIDGVIKDSAPEGGFTYKNEKGEDVINILTLRRIKARKRTEKKD